MHRPYTPAHAKIYAKHALQRELYGKATNYLQAQCNQIIEENNTLNCYGGVWGKAYYKGRAFQIVTPGTYRVVNVAGFDLHPSLHDKMDAFLMEKDRVQQEEDEILMFLSWFLAEVHAAKDMQNLLGDNLYRIIKSGMIHGIEPMSDDKMQEVAARSNNSIQIMQQRQLDNMLAADLYGV